MIARDSRRMKQIFVVKRGSFAVWKRLDPNGRTKKLDKSDLDPQDTGKSSILFAFFHLIFSFWLVVTEENEDEIDPSADDEATGDNETLFSEVQLTGDVEEASTSAPSAESIRLHRRSTIIDERRLSLAPHARTVNRSEIEKVNRRKNENF